MGILKCKCLILRLPDVTNFSTKYFLLSKLFTDEGCIKLLYHGLYACTGHNSLAKARGLSPHTGGQTMV